MAVTNNQTQAASTDTELPETDFEQESLINSDLLVNEDLLTDKQRRVVLATEAFVGRDDVSFSAIAQNAGVSVGHVRMTLRKFIDRKNLPADCRFGKLCSPLRDYDDLTEIQRTVVNERVVNPSMPIQQIAETADCSVSHARYTLEMYADIVESKRDKLCE